MQGVETPYGIIKSKVILNAAGVWSGNIAQMIGLNIPLVPMKHAYIVTEPMNVRGLPNLRDPDLDVYFRVQGGNMCIGGYEPNPIVLKSVSYPHAFNSARANAVAERSVCKVERPDVDSNDTCCKGTGRLLLQFVRAELGRVQPTRGSDEQTHTRSNDFRNKNDGVRPGKLHSRPQAYYGYKF